MNRRKILDILFKNVKYTNEQKEVLYGLEEAREEWEVASQYFENASEPELIDYAIYKEDAAKAKYMHYLSMAKQLGITIEPSFYVEQC